jgi:hypothetical protein
MIDGMRGQHATHSATAAVSLPLIFLDFDKKKVKKT